MTSWLKLAFSHGVWGWGWENKSWHQEFSLSLEGLPAVSWWIEQETQFETPSSDWQYQCNFNITGAFSPLGEVGCCTPSLDWRQQTRAEVSGWWAPGRLSGHETTSSDKLEVSGTVSQHQTCLTFPFQRRAAAPSALFYAFLTWNTF